MAGQRTRRRIPEATVARLPVYLQLLTTQFEDGVSNISSEELLAFTLLSLGAFLSSAICPNSVEALFEELPPSAVAFPFSFDILSSLCRKEPSCRDALQEIPT